MKRTIPLSYMMKKTGKTTELSQKADVWSELHGI